MVQRGPIESGTFFIQKPFTIETLLATIRNALERR